MSTTISGTNGVTFPDSTSMQTGQQACKAWVNFNGTGTVAIRGSYNVSSVTDNGTGDYTVNFTNAMSDANYSVSGSTGTGESSRVFSRYGSTQTTSTVRVVCVFPGSALFDDSQMHVAIFSN